MTTDSCCCPSEAGSTVCDHNTQNVQHQAHDTNACPVCGKKGKPVQGQTIKALLSVSLRKVADVAYHFCKTKDCPVVYFTPSGEQTFTTAHIRERVYQKEPEQNDVLVCYCFRHTLGDIRAAAPEKRTAIIEDINAGIQAGQCACDVRNPQGSCCLGNVRSVIKSLDTYGIGISPSQTSPA